MQRRKVLELFDKYKAYTDDRIKSGIDTYRKGFGTISIRDSEGNSVNAKVSVNQKSHEFRFGANIFMLEQFDTKEKNDIYKDSFKELFNMATLPFYWDDLEPEKGKTRYDKDSVNIYRRPAIDLCMEYCESNNIEPREHALAYNHFYPKWLDGYTLGESKQEYERRCREIAERYGDRINTIEVTNETWWDTHVSPLFDMPDFVEYSFGTARKYNQLVISEWSGVWRENGRTNDRYYMQIERALMKGTPIDAIGIQYHMFYHKDKEYDETRMYYNPRHLYRILDSYADFRLPVQITEVTIPAYSNDAADEEMQAEILKLLYSIWFSHKNVEQIIYWNVIDGFAAFAPQGDMTSGENYYYGGLLRYDFTKKPAYYMLKDLITKEWHTECSSDTTDGNMTFKGFYGDYDVRIECENGKVYNKEISLNSKSENEFEIIKPLPRSMFLSVPTLTRL